MAKRERKPKPVVANLNRAASTRLTDDQYAITEELKARLGIKSRSELVQIALQRLAHEQGLEWPPLPDGWIPGRGGWRGGGDPSLFKKRSDRS